MDAATIARVMSAIPERAAWVHSGTAFAAHDAQGAQVLYLAKFLQWMSPLTALTKDDQRALGLITTQQRPVDTDVEPDEDAELAVDGELDVEDEAEDFDPDATLPPLPPREEEKTEVLA
jgi:hypothetical protein